VRQPVAGVVSLGAWRLDHVAQLLIVVVTTALPAYGNP
jgi:hypothetical protein